MSSLYRRHRPQKWEEISGQNPIKQTIGQEIKDGHLAHAYLFAGPRGVGKTSIARIFAKAVNCTTRKTGENEPCNSCQNCLEITNGNSLDVLEIDAASHTGVDHVRETIIENARFAPSKSKYKVFIIDEVHMLSISAFNALLKIIEEPPAHVIFILATTELEKVPETIISRCQRFDFKKIPHQEIINQLKQIAKKENVIVEDEVYDRIARQSEGCLRDAEGLLGQLFSIGEESVTAETADLILPRFHTEKLTAFVEYLSDNNIAANLNLIQELGAEGVDLMLFHEQLIEFLRCVMIAKFNPTLLATSSHLNDSALSSFKNLANKFTSNKLSEILEQAVDAKKWWKNVRIFEMPLELMIIKMADTSSPASPAPKIKEIENSPIIKEPIQTPSPTIIKEIKTAIAEKSIATGAVSLDEIKKKWNDLLKRVQTYHHSLPVILRMSEPVSVVGNVLRISLKYTFHRDKIKERKMSDLVEKALMDVLGTALILEPVMVTVAETNPALPAEQKMELDDLIQTFGGHAVPSI